MITKAVTSQPYKPFDPVLTQREIPGTGQALQLGTLIVGPTGVAITSILSGTASWTPGSINSGASVSKTVTVAGAAVGNPVFVGVFPALPAGVIAGGQVTAGDTVTITLGNLSGSTVNLAAGTVRADVVQH